MSVNLKPFKREKGFERVGDFLIETNQPGDIFTTGGWVKKQ